MTKRNRVKLSRSARRNRRAQQMVVNQLSDLFDSGNTLGFGYGGPDGDVWVDLDTGNVDITFPDGSTEKISGDDPMAQAFWNPFGHENDDHFQEEKNAT